MEREATPCVFFGPCSCFVAKNPPRKRWQNEKKVIFVLWTVRKIETTVFLLSFSKSTGSPSRASPTPSCAIVRWRRTSSWMRWSTTGSDATRCRRIPTCRPTCSPRCATKRSTTCAISASASGRPTNCGIAPTVNWISASPRSRISPRSRFSLPKSVRSFGKRSTSCPAQTRRIFEMSRFENRKNAEIADELHLVGQDRRIPYRQGAQGAARAAEGLSALFSGLYFTLSGILR